MPTISVVMVSYKRPQWIVEAVESVINQTYQDWELIIGDSYPPESPIVALEPYLDSPHISFIQYPEPHLEPTQMFNLLVELAFGRYILPMCDDDKLDPTLMEKALDIFKKERTDLVYWDCKIFGEMDMIQKSPEWTLENFQKGNVTHGYWMCTKKLWNKLGGLDDLVYYDWDFGWRAYEADAKAYHIEEPLYHWRRHNNNMLDYIDLEKCRLDVIQKHSGGTNG